ncbi:MAG: hypothetical protein ACK5WC_00235 [Aphanizomenon sp.]|jgi:hypothetical protein
MKIVRLKSCAARENRNHPENGKKLMAELGLDSSAIEETSSQIGKNLGKEWASVIFETDTGDLLHLDITYREKGKNLGIAFVLAPHSGEITHHYSKYLELDCETGSVVKDSL